ncbi:MAG: extracellular solute-binding protein [Phycisphaerales bacterium]|nr:MAG: extracellular solute-binding protein [Phycisphaerales bacterium]
MSERSSDSSSGSSPRRRGVTLTRRAALGAIAAAGAGFVAFGPKGVRERHDGRIVLDYWEKWTGHEGKAMQTVVDRFNASQNRIFVRYLVTAGINQKALVAIAGGRPPDVIGLWNYDVPLFAESEGILPLDELGEPFGVRIENYAKGFQPIMQHPDHTGRVRMWATINTGGTLGLYYNRARFKEAGLDPDRPPRTFAEMDEFHARLTKVGKDGTIERVGFLPTEPGWWSWFWPYHRGQTIYDQASDTATIGAPEAVAAYEWAASYSKSLGVGPAEKFKSGFANSYDSPMNAFLTGQVAMVVQGPWLANVINAYRPDLDYGVGTFPVAEDLVDDSRPIGLVDSDILVIPRGVQHPEASMEFVAYTQRQDNVEYMATQHMKNSPMVSPSEEFVRNHPNRGIRTHNAIAQSSRAYLAPRTRIWPELKDILDTTFQQIWKHELVAEEALPSVQSRLQFLLDGAEERRRRRGYSMRGGTA